MNYTTYKKHRRSHNGGSPTVASEWGVLLPASNVRWALQWERKLAGDPELARRGAISAQLKKDINLRYVGGTHVPKYVWTTPMPVAFVPDGFDPAHVSLEITTSYDDCAETCADVIKAAGFKMEKADRYEPEQSRPYHHAVPFDYSGRNERPDPHWVYYPMNKAEDHFYGLSNALKGMSKSVRRQLTQEVLRGSAQSLVDAMEDRLQERTSTYVVSVGFLWRGEEVGSASLGGIEVSQDEDVIEAIFDYGMIEEAADEAIKWATKAVTDAQERALRIIRETALLPELALNTARTEAEREYLEAMSKVRQIRRA